MKRSLALLFTLAAAVAWAQTEVRTSPAGEAPLAVRSGRATFVGHFPNPAQTLRLTFGLVTPHPAEEEKFLEDLLK